MTKTREYDGKVYTYYFSYNTEEYAKKTLKVLREKGWNARIHKYTGLTGRKPTVYSVYRRFAHPSVGLVIKKKKRSKKRIQKTHNLPMQYKFKAPEKKKKVTKKRK